MATCFSCNQRLCSTSYSLTCSVCGSSFHTSCVPGVRNTDSIYVNKNDSDWMCVNCSEVVFPFNHIIDDSEFFKCITENVIINTKPSLAELETRLFDPFDLNEDNNVSYLLNSDPDIQYFKGAYTDLFNCKYYLEDTFKKTYVDTDKYENCFSMIHLNIRSLPKHFDELQLFLKNIKFEFNIIGLSETWLKEQNLSLYNILGYEYEHVFREKRIGGGVSLFIKNNIEYCCRNDLYVFNDDIETLFIEISKEQLGLDKNVIIGIIYRPPSTDIEKFINHMIEILAIIKRKNQFVYLMGDYNVNLLNLDKHILTSECLEMFYSYSFYPLINKPTRVTYQTASLIDNIYYNNIGNNNLQSGILFNDMTDHFPIFCILNSVRTVQKQSYIKKRIYSTNNITKFIAKLQILDWQNITCLQNCQTAFSTFYNKFNQLYNESFPEIRINTSSYHNRKPWLTKGLKHSIKLKNKLYVKSIKCPTLSNINYYKDYRNRLHSLLRRHERQYYCELLKQNKNNLSKQWKVINDIINKNKNRVLSDKFIVGNKILRDKKVIANQFNSFYVNIGPDLAKTISVNNKDPTSFILSNSCHSMFASPVVAEELKYIILLM